MIQLKDLGIITRNSRYAWQLSSDIKQLPFILPLTRNNSDSLPTTTTTNVVHNENLREKAVVVDDLRRNNSVSILELLHISDIFEPTASEIASLPHVTEDYLKAMITQAKHDGTSIPLLIHKIRCGDPKPKTPGDNRRSYIEGEFGKYIEH